MHPAYASYALNRSSEDVVAQYVASALACATATDKGACVMLLRPGWGQEGGTCWAECARLDSV